MKTSLLLSFASVFALGTAFAADFYRTGNSDTNWTNLDNWSSDALGEVPATSLPKNGDYVRFADAAEGTTTIFDSSNGNLNFDRLLSSANATVEFSSVTANVSNRIELGSVAGTADAYKTFNLTLSNGANLTTWLFFGTNAAYTNLVVNVTGNSTLTATSNTWDHFQLVEAADSKATLNIEEGSSVNIAANLAVNGTHSKAPRSQATVNVYGSLRSNGLYIGQSADSTGEVNLYGSSSCILTSSAQLLNANSSLNFRLSNVTNDRVAKVTDGQVEFVYDGILSFAYDGAAFGENKGSVNIDLQDFSMNEWVSWELGETYAISLITVAAEDYVFDTSFINILNEDKMGLWALASDDRNDFLKWDGTTLNLYVTAVPEPATYALMFGALAMFFAVSRRAKRN